MIISQEEHRSEIRLPRLDVMAEDRQPQKNESGSPIFQWIAIAAFQVNQFLLVVISLGAVRIIVKCPVRIITRKGGCKQTKDDQY